MAPFPHHRLRPPRPVILLILLLWLQQGAAQLRLLPVKGLPTNEVFDLMVDRRGFLWVAHDMGVSRFDGVSFTHFSHPMRSSLSISDLVEDRFGRIWMHNFTGQVFYIQNERMHLLKAYQNESEPYFPRMGLLGDELVVTSNRGLFVCDTRTLESRYLAPPGKPGATRSIAIAGRQVLAHDHKQWYLYDPQKGFRRAHVPASQLLRSEGSTLTLQINGLGDTALAAANPAGILYKLFVVNDSIRVADHEHVTNFINAAQEAGADFWIHGKERSYRYQGHHKEGEMQGYNISDMVVDHLGNRWFSSLNKGLLVAENTDRIARIQLPFLDADDIVTAVQRVGTNLMIGTHKGRLLEVVPSTMEAVGTWALPAEQGSVNLISEETDGQVLISTSLRTYMFDRRQRRVAPYVWFISKDVVAERNRYLIASSIGLFSVPRGQAKVEGMPNDIVALHTWNKHWQQSRLGSDEGQRSRLYWYQQRSRTLATMPNGELLVSFMTGVYKLCPKNAEPLLFNGKSLYSNSIVQIGNKAYIGTLNNGVIVYRDSVLKQIGANAGLFSNSVVRLRRNKHLLWVLQDRGIQLIDTRTDQIVNNIELPQESGSNVYDLANWGDTTLLATNNGLYRVLMQPSPRYQNLKSTLSLVVINQRDSTIATTATLGHQQNDLQFHLSVPWFNPGNDLYFRYRLKGASNDDTWFTTSAGERTVRFASLMPGEYVFEAYAVVAGFQERNPITFRFTIEKPWYRTIVFNLVLLSLAALFLYLLYRMRLRQVLRLEQVRRSISSDLHDEIGSTISSINIYSELAKSEQDNEPYLELIQENTREVITKLDDLVWSINPKNDSMEQLLARMRSFSEPVLQGAGIQPHFHLAGDLGHLDLPLPAKRNLYLVFKELVNNVVKHSQAANCIIELRMEQAQLLLSVADDGVGMPAAGHPTTRSGMSNLQERARQIKAQFSIARREGGGTIASLLLPIK